MAKGSGSTRAGGPGGSGAIERLKKSRNFFISAGMQYYDDNKDNPRIDFSDMDKLSETEKTYLVAYLSNAYGVVNDALRSNEPLNDEVKTLVAGIDRAVAKLDTFTGTVYRGLEFNSGRLLTDRREHAALLNYYKSNIGKEITERAYTSTGKVKSRIDRKFAGGDLNLRFTIDSKTGRNLSKFNDEEYEVLFKRGTRFRVVSVRGNNIHLQEV